MATSGSSTPPKPKMSGWKRALSYAIAAIFDFLKFIFVIFIFTAPLMAGLAAAAIAGQSSWLSWIPSSWVVTVVGGGVAGIEILQPQIAAVITFFGLMMAMAVGFAGALFMALWYMACGISFKDILLWWGIGLGGSVIPVVNILPALSAANWRILAAQSKKDREALQKWKADNVTRLVQDQKARAERTQQAQAVQAQIAEARQAANDNEEIPEEVREAA
ncbi:MAG: hypothetical protein Q7R54_03140 [bacterium]|nr:hypothetical protein [bacterium]